MTDCGGCPVLHGSISLPAGLFCGKHTQTELSFSSIRLLALLVLDLFHLRPIVPIHPFGKHLSLTSTYFSDIRLFSKNSHAEEQSSYMNFDNNIGSSCVDSVTVFCIKSASVQCPTVWLNTSLESHLLYVINIYNQQALRTLPSMMQVGLIQSAQALKSKD